MIVTALKATGDGGCSTPVQIRAGRALQSSPGVGIGIPLCHGGSWSKPTTGAGGSRESLCPPGSGWGSHATRVESSWSLHLPLLYGERR